MFRSDGWKHLTENLKGSAININAVEACQDDKDLYFSKGKLAVMANMLNLEAQIETAKEQQDEQEVELDS